ncbi:O-antigen ligase family protein [Helicobacter suis]|uniref:O-antigen ligase family protein n=1 Tax=Helicobacter suis TaxID=104628 RepID=UPI001F084693|nr:O-antigen ligase family protein [Helicobacter suis]
MELSAFNRVATLFFALFFLTSFKKPMAQTLLVLLALASLIYYFKYKPPLALNKPLKWLVVALLLSFLCVLPNLFVQSDLETWRYNLRVLNMPLIYLLGAITLICLSGISLQLNDKPIFYSMAFTCVINGVIALIQKIGLAIARTDGFSTIVGFATLSSIAILGCYIYAIYYASKNEKIAFTLAMLLGFIVLLFSATRSAWIAFTCTFLILSICILVLQKSLHALPYMLALTLIFTGMFFCNQALETKHLIQAPRALNQSFKQDLELYEHKNPDSSIGARLARWREAMAIVRLSPLFGMSLSTKCKHLEEIVKLAHSYRKANTIDCTEKYDNQIFNTLARTGLFGLGVLLLLWGVIFTLFWRALKTQPTLCLLMLSMLCFYIVLGIGFDPFSFFIEGSFFVGLIALGALHVKSAVAPDFRHAVAQIS